tara:strand:- start:37977 stop:38189 length:213 start_codon:yes stop_codon:yes gene_type:complete
MFNYSIAIATTALFGLSACAQNSNAENAFIAAGACAAASAAANQSDRDTALAAAGCGVGGALANDTGLSF